MDYSTIMEPALDAILPVFDMIESFLKMPGPAIAGICSIPVVVMLVFTYFVRRKPARCVPMEGVLRHRPGTHTDRCVWLLEELGARDSITLVREDDLAWDDECVFLTTEFVEFKDSTSACMALADTHGKLMPPVNGKPNYYRWLFQASVISDQDIVSAARKKRRDPLQEEEHMGAHAKKVQDFIEELDAHLDGKQYICGSKFTVADVIVGYVIHVSSLVSSGELLVDAPHVLDYLQRMKRRPGFEKTLTSELNLMDSRDIIDSNDFSESNELKDDMVDTNDLVESNENLQSKVTLESNDMVVPNASLESHDSLLNDSLSNELLPNDLLESHDLLESSVLPQSNDLSLSIDFLQLKSLLLSNDLTDSNDSFKSNELRVSHCSTKVHESNESQKLSESRESIVSHESNESQGPIDSLKSNESPSGTDTGTRVKPPDVSTRVKDSRIPRFMIRS